MYQAKTYAAASATSSLAAATITRRDPTEHDVQIEILFCGICHSDLHQVRNQWKSVMATVYPCVPGHEIIGRVTKVGSAVSERLAAWWTRIALVPSARPGSSSSVPTSP